MNGYPGFQESFDSWLEPAAGVFLKSNRWCFSTSNYVKLSVESSFFVWKTNIRPTAPGVVLLAGEEMTPRVPQIGIAFGGFLPGRSAGAFGLVAAWYSHS